MDKCRRKKLDCDCRPRRSPFTSRFRRRNRLHSRWKRPTTTKRVSKWPTYAADVAIYLQKAWEKDAKLFFFLAAVGIEKPIILPLPIFSDNLIALALAKSAIPSASASLPLRRPRGEKRPIPEDEKDSRYYERRKRNNLAAKKSRDSRKRREDRIAKRAAELESENAALRLEMASLRQEMTTLQTLLLKRRLVKRDDDGGESTSEELTKGLAIIAAAANANVTNINE